MHLSFWHPVDSVKRRQGTPQILPSTCQCFLGISQVPLTMLLPLLGGAPHEEVPELKGIAYGAKSQRSESCQSSQKPSGAASCLPVASASVVWTRWFLLWV